MSIRFRTSAKMSNSHAQYASKSGFSKELLGQHVRTCVADDLRNGSSEKLDELLTLLPKLMK